MRASRRVTGCETEAAEPSRGRRRRRPLQSVVTLLTGVRGRSAEGRIVPVMGLHPRAEEEEGRGDNTTGVQGVSRTFSREVRMDGWLDGKRGRRREGGPQRGGRTGLTGLPATVSVQMWSHRHQTRTWSFQSSVTFRKET